MRVRKLQMKDAPLMLEWMHELDVVKDLRGNFLEKTLADCQAFITAAQDLNANLHLAVVDEEDTYMGTVSLKNIRDGAAEFAITMRTCAMGKGYARYAMDQILRIGFEQRGLDVICWCVSPQNQRALGFYDKNGYQQMEKGVYYTGMDSYSSENNRNLIWYCVKRDMMTGKL